MKYIKNPVEVEAFQYDGSLLDEHGAPRVPWWAADAYKDGQLYYALEKKKILVNVLHLVSYGCDVVVNIGDYIVNNADGHLCAFSKEVFEKNYTAVKEE